MSSLNYTTYVSQTANLMAAVSSDPNFVTMLPGAIDYAEQRIYRDLDLLYTQVTDSTFQVSSGNQLAVLPSSGSGEPPIVVVESISIWTPAINPASFSSAARTPLIPASIDFINASFTTPTSTACGVPEYYAVRPTNPGQQGYSILLGPAPDQSYWMEVIGRLRPSSLSSANSSTILTQYVPDLFMAATMVFVSGYMRDFGQQADNPQMGTAWEQQYQMLMKSALVEQFRAKFQSEAWTSQMPNQLVKPERR